ncbi:hypothetical protein HUW46_08420 [Amycolatopsis sp. CA-230715]|nr:hypothetical protein HUW46_08420 [Amycolatopsis sp. CA-230715]
MRDGGEFDGISRRVLGCWATAGGVVRNMADGDNLGDGRRLSEGGRWIVAGYRSTARCGYSLAGAI